VFLWLDRLAGWVVTTLFGLERGTRFGEAVHFFLYDTVKILILLALVTVVMGVVNSYFPVERIRDVLARRQWFGGEYLGASLFGAVTPFCSCSSVPLFIGFVKGGLPLGVTLAFLITSPLVNEIAVAIFIGMFGLKATAIYVATGVTLGAVAGAVLGRLRLEAHLTPWVQELLSQQRARGAAGPDRRPFTARVPDIVREARDIVRSVALYVVIGIGIGAAIHGFVPTGFFETYITADNPLGVPLAVLLGIPMYANAAGVLPVIQVLITKGVPIGTALAFMMAVIGLSLPEATLLRKVMDLRLIAVFFAVVASCIIASGYFFNVVL
jgi:uncharacterized protein